MKFSENVVNILAASLYKNIGNATLAKSLSTPKNEQEIVEIIKQKTSQKDIVCIEDFQEKKQLIKSQILSQNNYADGVVCIADENFPPYRGNVKDTDKPIVLFYKGNLDLLNLENHNVAVIGLLKPDLNIEKIEQKVVSELVKQKSTIVSGLAFGCDTIAHKQALESYGKTIAILPSPLSKILPSANENLAREIELNEGLLISEYYNEPQNKFEFSKRYIDRDRLQALFSDAIILSASYAPNNQGKDSGSRHAMQKALEYGIKRAVIYENFSQNNEMFDLNRQILNEKDKPILINGGNLLESIKKITTKNVNIKKGLFD